MIRLHDDTLSDSCYKVRLLLHFLGLEHEVVPVDVYPGRAHKTPSFLALNPLGQVPVLQDDGLVLRDAQAILCYLARRYDKDRTWLPSEPCDFGQVTQWLSFAGAELIAASDARLHDMLGYALDVAAARARGHAALTVLDDHLTQRRLSGGIWLVGDTPTIADVACFPCVALSGDGSIGHEHYPALRIWIKAVRRLPNFRAMPGIPDFV